MLSNDLAFWTNVVSIHVYILVHLTVNPFLFPLLLVFPFSVLYLFLSPFSLILSLSVFLYLCRLINATTTRFAPCTQLHHLKFLSFNLSSWIWWLRHCKTGCLPEYCIDYTFNACNHIAWKTSYDKDRRFYFRELHWSELSYDIRNNRNNYFVIIHK